MPVNREVPTGSFCAEPGNDLQVQRNIEARVVFHAFFLNVVHYGDPAAAGSHPRIRRIGPSVRVFATSAAR